MVARFLKTKSHDALCPAPQLPDFKVSSGGTRRG